MKPGAFSHLILGPIFSEALLVDIRQNLVHLLETSQIISVDGGLDLARELGLIPDLHLGDDDSISKSGLRFLETHAIERRRFDSDKDFSDFAAALDSLPSDAQVLVLGMSGGRLDQQLAVIGEGLAHTLASLCFYGEHELTQVVSARNLPYHASIVDDAEFSVLGLSEELVVSISSAKWELSHAKLSQLSSHGLSNVGPAEIVIEQGDGLIITNR